MFWISLPFALNDLREKWEHHWDNPIFEPFIFIQCQISSLTRVSAFILFFVGCLTWQYFNFLDMFRFCFAIRQISFGLFSNFVFWVIFPQRRREDENMNAERKITPEIQIALFFVVNSIWFHEWVTNIKVFLIFPHKMQCFRVIRYRKKTQFQLSFISWNHFIFWLCCC